MDEALNNLAIFIPARGGSERFPAKGLATLDGVSLIRLTYHFAQTYTRRVFLSSDSDDYLAQVPAEARIKRPVELCESRPYGAELWQHFASLVDAEWYGMMSPTCPIRGRRCFTLGLNEFFASKKKSGFTAYLHRGRVWRGGVGINGETPGQFVSGNQECWIEDGSFYVMHRSLVPTARHNIGDSDPFIIPNRVLFDIDFREDHLYLHQWLHDLKVAREFVQNSYY
jgi:CMP-N-acetylneuraminic acid synthetase